MKKGLLVAMLLTALLCPAQAVLIDRGTGMIYDTDQGITWLQDANYAQTSGYDADGKMNWYQANAWASGLNYSGYTGWRLQNGGNLPSGGELGYMYFNNLQGSNGPFLNLQSDYYWSSNEYPEYPQFAYVFNFDPTTDNHAQIFTYKDHEVFAWAVRDGDYGPSVSIENPYAELLTLLDRISFDYFWVIKQAPASSQIFDVQVFTASIGWQTLGQFTASNSSSDWVTATVAVPTALRGLATTTQVRFVLTSYESEAGPTVYLRNIASISLPPFTVNIDIDSKDSTNIINLRKDKTISVAILSGTDFSAPSDVDPATLTFGAYGDEQSFKRCARKAKDVDKDGLLDLVCRFSVKAAGFQCGDDEGILQGKTVNGLPFEGRQTIVIRPCQ